MNEEIETLWRVKVSVIPMIIRPLGAVTLKLERVASTDPRSKLRDLSRAGCSPRNIKLTP